MIAMERRLEVAAEIPQLHFLDTGLPVRYPVWTGLKEELRTEESLFSSTPEQESRAVKVFSAADQFIPKPVKNYANRVGERIKPEAWTAAAATDITSIFVLPAVQGLIALNTHSGLDITSPKLAVAAALTGISLMADWYALRKKGWDISIVGCITQAFSGRPSLSAILEHTINYIGPLNFVNIGAFATGNFSFMVDNIMAAPFVLAPWYIGMNLAIGHGQADRVLIPIRKVEDATLGRIKQAMKR
jgi:hypothetical protein